MLESVISALIISSVTALVAYLTIKHSMKQFLAQKSWEQKERAEALKVALGGEVDSIRLMLSGAVQTGFEIYEEGGVPKAEVLTYPKAVFESNAGSLGELRDPKLVGHLSNLYAILYRIEQMETTDFKKLLSLLTVALKSSVLVDAILSKQTEHLDWVSWEDIQLSTKDAGDLNFCNKVLDQLRAEK